MRIRTIFLAQVRLCQAVLWVSMAGAVAVALGEPGEIDPGFELFKTEEGPQLNALVMAGNQPVVSFDDGTRSLRPTGCGLQWCPVNTESGFSR